MQRTMIALWGISNVGKTTTIRQVYDRLKQQGTDVDPGDPVRKEVKGAILEIDGVKIGFISQGDLEEILLEYLEPLIEAGCTIIICATHTRGRTVEVVKRLASEADPRYEIVWIDKIREPD